MKFYVGTSNVGTFCSDEMTFLQAKCSWVAHIGGHEGSVEVRGQTAYMY